MQVCILFRPIFSELSVAGPSTLSFFFVTLHPIAGPVAVMDLELHVWTYVRRD